MNKELPERIYFKNDINKAFDWELQTGLAVFERSIGLSFDNPQPIRNQKQKRS